MIILRDVGDVPLVVNPEIRQLISQRIQDLSLDEPWDANSLGPFIVVEPGDQPGALNEQLGFPILNSRINGTQFGDVGFMPSHEILEAHADCYEIVFILSDDGYGVSVFVPKDTSVDRDLLAMCARYAAPGSTD